VTYSLDSNICVAILNDSSQKVTQSIRKATSAGEELFLSSIVLHELWFGVAKSQRVSRNAAILTEFIHGAYPILDFSNGDAEVAGQIRAHLKAIGTPIGAYDTLIAGQALARGLTLVTVNTREFSRVDGLRLVDWTQ
jgi:tRNA(fMet)-specific endonuclease VapC